MWETVGYNDHHIMTHPLKDKVIVWMEAYGDLKKPQLELMSGDSLDWQAIIRGKVSDKEVLEHAGKDGTTKRS